MTNDKLLNDLKRLDDILNHIQNVQNAGVKLAKRLMEHGETEFAINLVANVMKHDQSKFRGLEWDLLIDNPNTCDSDLKKLVIQHHQKQNEHHPEYWGDIKNMPRIYVAEMVCDWFARSVEMGTDLRGYIKDTACERFGISQQGKVYKWIKEFVDLLLEKPFT